MSEYSYENLEPGEKIVTRTRIITSSEIELISALVGVTNPIFQSKEAAKSQGFDDKITPGAVIEAYAIGMEYQTGIYDGMIVLVEVDQLRFKAPLFHNSSLRSELEVLSKRETSRRDRAIVVFQRRCYSNEKEILEGRLTFLYRRASLPRLQDPTTSEDGYSS